MLGVVVEVLHATRRLRRFANEPVSVMVGSTSSNERSTTSMAGKLCSDFRVVR